MGVLIAVIIYEVLSIGGVSLYIKLKQKANPVEALEGDDFATAGRSLPPSIVGASIALAVLGSVHVFGIMEVSFGMGFISVWFSIAHVVLICVICLATGRFVRRTRVATVPELAGKLYNRKVTVAIVAVIAMSTFAILTMEVQALGIIFNALTLGKVSIIGGTVIGCIIGVAYVITAGMKEVGFVNMINTIVMYVALIIAIIFLSRSLITGEDQTPGWDNIKDFYISTGETWRLSVFGTGSPMNSLFNFGIPTVIAVTFAQGISQMGLSATMAAKSEKTVVKSLKYAAPINGLFGIFTAAIGVAAFAMFQSGQLGELVEPAKQAGIQMIMQFLPPWVVALLLAAFLGAVLSTFAITTLGLGTMFVKDAFVHKFPDAPERIQTKWMRIFIVVAAIVACVATTRMPAIINGANWCFAWLCPVFFTIVFGLFWKRSNVVAALTLGVSWILVLLWTFTPIFTSIGLDAFPIPYVTLITTIVISVVGNCVVKGKPGYFKEQKALK